MTEKTLTIIPSPFRGLRYCRGFLFSAFLFIQSQAGFAQSESIGEGEVLTISQALSIAIRNNPEIIAARYRQDATAEATTQAWARALPSVTAQGSIARQDNDQIVNSDLFGVGKNEKRNFSLDPISASITAEQTLFDGFETINSIRQARAQRSAGRFQVTAVEQNILRRTSAAFIAILRDEKIEKAIRTSLDAHMEELKRAKVRYSRGEGTLTDIRQAEARLAGVRARRAKAQSEVHLGRTQLKELLGDIDVTLDKTPFKPLVPSTLDSALNMARARAPMIEQARATLRSSDYRKKAQRGAFAPQVNAFVSYDYRDEPTPFTVRDEKFTYGLRVDVPLFQGGSLLSKRREARAIFNSDRARLKSIERQLHARVTTHWRRMKEAEVNIIAAKRQIDAATFVVKGAQAEVRQGSRPVIDILDAEKERAEAEILLVRSESDLVISMIDLLAEIGVLAPTRFSES